MGVLELRDVSYTYQTQYQKVEALRNITASFDWGKVYAVVGKSGSGKTTLLSLLAGLDLPTVGEVLCHDVATSQMKLEQYDNQLMLVQRYQYLLLVYIQACLKRIPSLQILNASIHHSHHIVAKYLDEEYEWQDSNFVKEMGLYYRQKDRLLQQEYQMFSSMMMLRPLMDHYGIID